jgi:hypothetical protein
VGAGLVLTGCAAGGTAREPVDPQPASPTVAVSADRDSESEWPAGQPYPDLVIENADQADVDGATWYTISAVTELHAARDLASWSLTGSWGPSPGPVEGVSGVRAGHAVGPLAPSPCAIAGSE